MYLFMLFFFGSFINLSRPKIFNAQKPFEPQQKTAINHVTTFMPSPMGWLAQHLIPSKQDKFSDIFLRPQPQTKFLPDLAIYLSQSSKFGYQNPKIQLLLNMNLFDKTLPHTGPYP